MPSLLPTHLTVWLLLLPALLPAQEPAPTTSPLQFYKQELASAFTCEGASFGDLDGDGHNDIVAGPFWYRGPDFRQRGELLPYRQFSPLQYSDHFFSWVLDLDGDGHNDVFVIGFPGKEAYWLRNEGGASSFTRHVVADGVDNESPWFGDLFGDGRPALVCQHDDRVGYFAPTSADLRAAWTFHAISPAGAGGRFTHGLGVGDLDGDGKNDILHKGGWFRQPAERGDGELWPFQPFPFAPRGGAQMLVVDVDGDGRADVITSYAAHAWGLGWFRQLPDGGFAQHQILPSRPAPGNVSELHALTLGDLDGDGLPDLVTGKRWWSHGPSKDRNLDGGNDPPLLLAFLLRRTADGPVFEQVVIDHDSGVGTQVMTGDIDGDGKTDIVVANKRGSFIFTQRERPTELLPELDFESGTLRGWTHEGTAFRGQPIRGDTVAVRKQGQQSGHRGDYWIGGYELLGDAARGTLTSAPFAVTSPWASFLVGGGSSEATRVEILAADRNDERICWASGRDRETMHAVLVDLRDHLGSNIRIRLVDDADGGWGHLNFDDFRFHDEPVRGDLPEGAGGLSPSAAAAAMTALPGFQVDLIAAEPELHQPVALWVDERGRLWVAEAYSYPTRRDDSEAKDAIVVFEDRDGDGRYETRTVFYDRLNLVSGLCVGYGGVYVGAAPHLWFIPDRDGDLVPDGPPELLLDGFGYQDTHETLNSFTWGPDGWLYGTHGVFTHSKVGRPGTPEADRVPLNCGVWRMHPRTLDFEVFAWGSSNPWGLDFDERGEAFLVCCVIKHMFHAVQGSRMKRQSGSHFDAYPWRELQSIADHQHWAGDIADHAWWRGRDNAVLDPGTDAAGGGHAHCGGMIYKGLTFPAEYRSAMLFHNIHGNRINVDLLERDRSGYVARHAPDLVKANDPWFRGVALRQGAAGEVFFIDWYDRSACHRKRVELWDRSNGRLYRLSYGAPRAVAPKLVELADQELAALQTSRDDFYAGHARRLLAERAPISASASGILRSLLQQHPEPTTRLRALWTLHVTGELPDQHLVSLLADPVAEIRAWAVRCAAERPTAAPLTIQQLPAMARNEPAAAVRLALAAALQRLPAAAALPLANSLLQHAADAADQNLPVLLWYGCEPLCNADAAAAVQLARDCQLTELQQLLWRRLASGDDDTRGLLLQAAATDQQHQLAILDQFLAAQRKRPELQAPPGFATVAGQLGDSKNSTVRERIADLALAYGDSSLAPLIRARLADPQRPLEERKTALELLLRSKDPATGPLLLELLQEPPLRALALQGLAAYELPTAADAVLALLPQLDPTEREVALVSLCARPATARSMLQAICRGEHSPRLLDAASLRRQIQALDDPELAPLLQRAWGRSVPVQPSAAAEIARYKTLLSPEFLATADVSNGRSIFSRTCQACHKLYGQGGVLGPDLTGSNRRDLDYLLAKIIEPSAEMSREHQLVQLHLRDGRLLSGNLVRETEGSLLLRSLLGEQTVLRSELAADTAERPAIEFLPVSLMPPGQLQALPEADARDLIAYLQSERQAPLLAAAENLGSFWNGRDLTGWDADPELWSVVDGELVGRTTTGLSRNNFARSQLLLGDFRLICEVKLTPASGNSGIQFRSAVRDGGDVAGYQADIGQGWWGLLYEEHGRGVLQKARVEAAIAEDWNRYEILATGDRIQLAINGKQTVDLVDPDGARRGILALQIHSGGPTEVRFRKFALELAPEPVLQTVAD